MRLFLSWWGILLTNGDGLLLCALMGRLMDDKEAQEWFAGETERLAKLRILKGQKLDQKLIIRRWDELVGQFLTVKQAGTASKEHTPW